MRHGARPDGRCSRDEKGIEIFSSPRQQEGNRRDREDDEQDRSWRDATPRHLRLGPVPDQRAAPSRPDRDSLRRREKCRPACGTACAGWPEGKASRSSASPAARPTAPRCGPPAASASSPTSSDGQAIWALAHQLGHVLLHNTTAVSPGTTTSGCQGVRKAEADSVAFITCARHGVQIEHAFSSPQTWAGSDPRAQPGAAILAAGERITTAAAKISRYLDQHLPGSTTGQATPARTSKRQR